MWAASDAAVTGYLKHKSIASTTEWPKAVPVNARTLSQGAPLQKAPSHWPLSNLYRGQWRKTESAKIRPVPTSERARRSIREL